MYCRGGIDPLEMTSSALWASLPCWPHREKLSLRAPLVRPGARATTSERCSCNTAKRSGCCGSRSRTRAIFAASADGHGAACTTGGFECCQPYGTSCMRRKAPRRWRPRGTDPTASVTPRRGIPVSVVAHLVMAGLRLRTDGCPSWSSWQRASPEGATGFLCRRLLLHLSAMASAPDGEGRRSPGSDHSHRRPDERALARHAGVHRADVRPLRIRGAFVAAGTCGVRVRNGRPSSPTSCCGEPRLDGARRRRPRVGRPHLGDSWSYLDALGNVCRRLTPPPGDSLTRYSAGRGAPEPDACARDAGAGAQRPAERGAVFTLPSRFCPSDELRRRPGTCSATSFPVVTRIVAVSDWVQRGVLFG